MRQIAPGNRLGWVTEWPVARSAAMAEDGSPLAHRVEVPAEDWTTTVTPLVPEQAAACAGAAAPTRPVAARVVATATARTRCAREPRITGGPRDGVRRGSSQRRRGGGALRS